MSTGLELWPIALAVGAAVQVARKRRTSATQQGAGPSLWEAEIPSPSGEVLTVPTRARDGALLAQALDSCGRHFATVDGVVYGSLGGVAVAFVRGAEEAYEGHFDGATEPSEALRLVGDLEEEYTLRVQQHSYTRLLERAPLHGLSFESETVEGEDIIVTLRVGEEAR